MPATNVDHALELARAEARMLADQFRQARAVLRVRPWDGAWNVLDALDHNVDAWLAQNPDFDIEDDLSYVRKFKTNIDAKRPPDSEPTPAPVPEPWPQD